ncbi:hypothetical protein [Nitrospira sp. M1]
MEVVFFGGSRKTRVLNEVIRAQIENVMEKELSILIGDANGADKAMQTYLADRGYRSVTIFCAGSECRNNIGQWETRNIQMNGKEKNFAFYAAKDKAMSEEADYGLMLWDGISNGTLNNVLNLVERGKQVALYFSPKKEFLTIQSLDDIKSLLSKCLPENIRSFDNKIGLSKRVDAPPSQLSLI